MSTLRLVSCHDRVFNALAGHCGGGRSLSPFADPRLPRPIPLAQNNHATLFSSMNFVGIVIGMLTFGYLVDRAGRKIGMILATVIIIVFTALQAGAYGVGGSTESMLQALIAYRCLGGIGIGAE